jgi:hypothetical protein
VTMSRQMATLMIKSSKQFVNDYPNASGCVYQQSMASLSDDSNHLQGLPCYECKCLIELGDECIRKRSNKSSKYYHTDCAKEKNLI